MCFSRGGLPIYKNTAIITLQAIVQCFRSYCLVNLGIRRFLIEYIFLLEINTENKSLSSLFHHDTSIYHIHCPLLLLAKWFYSNAGLHSCLLHMKYQLIINQSLLNFPIYIFMKIDCDLARLGKLDQSTPIYSPRTAFKNIREMDQNLLGDLTLHFDQFTIDILKEQFKNNDQKMSLIQFLIVVTEHLKTWQVDLTNRNTKLIRCLTNLFYEIDLNDNKILQWNQFTSYVIQKATVLKNIKTKSQQIKKYTKSANKPKQKFRALISKVIYIHNQDRIAFYQEGKDKIYFMNPQNGQIDKKTLVIHPKQIVVKITGPKKQGEIKDRQKDFIITSKTRILDMIFINDHKYQILLTSTSDKYVRGWKLGTNGYILASQPDNQEQVIEHKFHSEIYKLAWDSLNEYLFCGQKNGAIIIWNLKTDSQKQLQKGIVEQNKVKKDAQKRKQNQGHTMQINDIIVMPKLQFMASAGMDKKLILWDTINNKIKRVYTEHSRGILSLAFNQFLILLFSAGFDHQICIWNPYIKNIIHKIQGHSAPILRLEVIQDTSQLISMDQQGFVRISDSRRFNIISSFSVQSSDQKHKFNPLCFTYIKKPLKLIFSGRSIITYDYDKHYNPNYIDDSPAICCKFVESMLCFFTPCGTKVKIWNALTGDIFKIFLNITTSDISAFQFDSRQKRMIIGCVDGQVSLFNIMNGAKLKNLPRHNGQVLIILNALVQTNTDLFITCSTDNKILISKDDMFGQAVRLRQLQVSKDTFLTTISYCDQTKSILVGTNLGIIGYYESQTGKLLPNVFNKDHHEDVVCIRFLGDLPFVLSCTAYGKIQLIAMPPLQFKFLTLLQWTNKDLYQKNECPIPISNTIYDNSHNWFICTDDKGTIKCYDLSQIYEQLKDYKVPKKFKNVSNEKYNRKILQIPNLKKFKSRIVWMVRGHSELIKSLNINQSQGFLFTTSFDKKAKIWSLQNGGFIDYLQQNYDRIKPQPIAYKKLSTEQIYSANLRDRIDRNEQEGMANQPKSVQEQFNPFYNLQRINLQLLNQRKSNNLWRVQLNIPKYYKMYQQKFDEVIKQFQLSVQVAKIKKRKMLTSKTFINFPSDKRNTMTLQSPVHFREDPLQNNYFRNSKGERVKLKKQEIKIFKGFKNQTKESKTVEQRQRNIQRHRRHIDFLYQRECASKLMFKHEPKIELPKQSMKYMYNLTMALSATKQHDFRSLKLLNSFSSKQINQ